MRYMGVLLRRIFLLSYATSLSSSERRTPPEAALDLWVLVHPDLRRSARLEIFRDAIVEAIKSHHRRLEGRSLDSGTTP